jgi:hypothetical protein
MDFAKKRLAAAIAEQQEEDDVIMHHLDKVVEGDVPDEVVVFVSWVRTMCGG